MYISSHSPIVNAPLPPCTTCLCIPQLKVEAEKVQMALLLERQHNLLELFGKDTHSQGGHSQLGLLGGGDTSYGDERKTSGGSFGLHSSAVGGCEKEDSGWYKCGVKCRAVYGRYKSISEKLGFPHVCPVPHVQTVCTAPPVPPWILCHRPDRARPPAGPSLQDGIHTSPWGQQRRGRRREAARAARGGQLRARAPRHLAGDGGELLGKGATLGACTGAPGRGRR